MPWEYLSTKPLDARFLFVAGYLQHRNLIKGKRLVDLNCGTARLLHYIPHTFASYVANDIHQQPERFEPNLDFFSLADFEMVDRLRNEDLDVLMLFGTADARLCGSSWESRTSVDSFLSLVRHHSPGTLIIEGSLEYDRNFGAIGALLRELDPYEVEHDVTISAAGQGGHGTRRILALTPRARPYNVHRRLNESIHEYYLRRSIECVSQFKKPRVLKTDACNESHDNLPIPGGIALNLPEEATVTVLEWDAAVIAAARSAHPGLDLRQGDIRTLADLSSGAFDVVLDLSTLDHIQPRDVPRALASYRRVLRENGILLLVFWASVDAQVIAEGDAGEWSHGRQYYFEVNFVRSTLAALQFELISEDHVYVSGSEILDCIKCRASSRT